MAKTKGNLWLVRIFDRFYMVIYIWSFIYCLFKFDIIVQ